METYHSDFIIDSQYSTLLRNLTTFWNKIITLNWYEKYQDVIDSNKMPQGIQKDWNFVVWIAGNTLYVRNENTWILMEYPNAVWETFDWSYSTEEHYNICIYKRKVFITNSLQDSSTKHFNIGEPVRVFDVWWNEIVKNSINFADKNTYAPRVTLVHNGILYFGGSPNSSNLKNVIFTWSWMQENNIYFSEETEYNNLLTITPILQQFIYIGDWSPITSMFVDNGNIFVWTQESIYYITLEWYQDIAWFSRIRYTPVKFASHWIMHQYAVVYCNGTTIYYDWSSIRRLDRERVSNVRDNAISKPIQNILDCLPRIQNTATASFSYPLYKLHLRENQRAKTNNITIVHNIEDNTFSIQTGINTNYTASSYNQLNNGYSSLFMDSLTPTIYKDNVWSDYDGYERDFEWIWVSLNPNDCVSSTTIKNIIVSWNMSKNISFWLFFDFYKMNWNTGCVEEAKSEKQDFCWCSDTSKTTWNVTIWQATPGKFDFTRCSNTLLFIKTFTPCYKWRSIEWIRAKPHIVWSGYGQWEMDFYKIINQ
jgi:hypothetical protein